MDIDEAIEFLKEVEDDTLLNVHKILKRCAIYAYQQDKVASDYTDLFLLIGIAHCKVEKLLKLKP